MEECDKRQERLKRYEKKIDEWNRALRDLAQDLEVLRRTKDSLEVESRAI